MNKIRDIIGSLFQSPMQQMSFPAYFAYVNAAGKVTARSVMELSAVILTLLEAQEKKNDVYEQQFREIQAILEKMAALPTQVPESPILPLCLDCGKTFKSQLGLMGHMKTHNADK